LILPAISKKFGAENTLPRSPKNKFPKEVKEWLGQLSVDRFIIAVAEAPEVSKKFCAKIHATERQVVSTGAEDNSVETNLTRCREIGSA
jgi:hypothetical protein